MFAVWRKRESFNLAKKYLPSLTGIAYPETPIEEQQSHIPP